MKRILGVLAAGGLSLLAANAAHADGMVGPRAGSIKDSAPVMAGGCGGRFQGAYIGGNLGYTKSTAKWEELFADYNDFQDQPFTKGSGSISGGAQIGYNWQHCSRWLFGVEADFNKMDAGFGPQTLVSIPSPAGSITISNSMKAVATLRARLGVVANDRTLIYGTAGLAWADINHDVRDILHWSGSPPLDHTDNGWKRGYVVGGGFETALNRLVSLKGEALYMDFGKHTHFDNDRATPVPDVYVWRHGNTAWTARLGLNIKLGADAPPPVEPVAYAPPPANPCSGKGASKLPECKPLK